MKSVCICGSFRFYEEMVQLRNALQSRGVLCEWPLPGPRLAPQAMTADEARDAIMRHLEPWIGQRSSSYSTKAAISGTVWWWKSAMPTRDANRSTRLLLSQLHS
jgi:hypothetical protein